MTASRSDMNLLGIDAAFTARVRASMISAAINISSEGFAVAFHKQRADQAAAVLAAPESFKTLFAASVATDANVIADATQGGTVVLTSGNAATQGALVTDGHIDAAVSAQWNAFLRLP